MKKKVWALLLVFAVLVTTVNFPAVAGAEEEADTSGVVIKVKNDMNGSDTEESDEIQTVQISAQNQGNTDAVVRISLLNEDKETADTEVETPNLCEKDRITDETVQKDMAKTLESALTLSDGTNASLDAQWVEKKDDNGAVTARYLEASLPAGAAAAFDMQLMYRTDEENYTKKTIVQAKAFVNEQDVTEASDEEDEDNEAEVKWEVVKKDDESEAAEESEETAGSAAKVSRAAAKSTAENGISTLSENSDVITFYYVANTDWTNRLENQGYSLRANVQNGSGDDSGWQWFNMSDTGRTVNGRRAYQADCDRSFLRWGGAQTIQIHLFDTNGNQVSNTFVTIVTGWADESVFSGNVYIDNGWKEYTPDIISAAGTELTFYDMTGTLEGDITAQFSTNSNLSNAVSVQVTDGKVTVPADKNGEIYRYIRFINGDSEFTEIYDLLGDINVIGGNTTFYYGRTSLQNGGMISSWGSPMKENDSLAGKTLYFGSDTFNINSEITIDDGESVVVDHPSDTNNVLSYTFDNDSSATQQSIISVTANGIIYRFFWMDDSYNKVTVVDNVADVNDMYSTAKRIYFDSSLSKLSYAGTENVKNGGQGIPYNDNSNVYVYATGTNVAPISAQPMTRVDETDIYYYELPAGYTQIRFAGYAVSDANESQNGDATDMLTIPMGYTQPCFFADSSDDVIYNGGNRGGYWDEYGSVRDAESGKNTDVVDIPTGTFTRESDILYVDTTLYDYYTDYELNGNNRDNYDADATVNSHRIYQPFRLFDQALGGYYWENSAVSPLYWGNFQNYEGSHFTEISDTLNLFGFDKNSGSDTYRKFFYENNSMWGRDGNEIDKGGQNATQGLVAESLSDDGNLQIKTETGTVDAPYFNSDFLNGTNAKNTVLGDVYNNISFPFVKKELENESDDSVTGTVGYWYFDSADTEAANKNLQLQYSSEDGYFLQSASEVKGQTAESGNPATTNGNYFPFNSSAQSGKSALLNYGFGQKIEFTFRLTEDGTVKTSTGDKAPIEFNFSGDDDVWVFIDGELVLDVGGGHDVVSGTINFKDLESVVSCVKNSTGGGATDNVTTPFPDSLKNNDDFYNEEHTLTMFYMERGLWESNMKITFNFPDENEFAVEKQVDDSDVNQELFGGLFDNASVFPFTIQNQATHYGTKEVESSEAAEPKTFNDTFNSEEVSSSWSTNVFEPVESLGGRNDVVHWYAYDNDVGGTYKDRRFGVIKPAGGGTFNASAANAYLQFKFYYEYNDTPGLAYIYLELEDASGHKMGGYLSGKVYGNSSLSQNTWNTIQVDLSKMVGYDSFDFEHVKNIKFNYDYPRNIYLDDFTFIPSVVAQGKTGFITAQHEIPDYGSATSGKLEYPEGAQYTLEKSNGATQEYKLGSDGMFALADGETATFKDQFRRGSYISVTEDINPDVFETTWTLYENGSPVRNMNDGSTIEIIDPVSVNGVSGTTLKDGRQEVHTSGQDDQGQEISNSGYTETGWAKDSSGQSNSNTIVFRSYSRPDDETVLTKLKAVFVNKVKTGSIVIQKDKTDDSSDLEGSYTFRVTFSNVAGMSLEQSSITREYTIKYGESVKIDGIPVGTSYTIEEIKADDGATLENVVINGKNASFNPVSKKVTGTVTADESAELVFKNTLKPTVNINLEKIWAGTEEGVDIPDSIMIQLQRSSDDGKTWEAVRYGDTDYIELRMNYEGKWEYAFEDLDQYVDYKADPQVPWLYRVVELDKDNKPIESGGYLGDYFKVTYSDNLKFVGENPEDGNFTITNTYSPKTGLKITKVDASDTNKKLGGVEFTLEKGTIENGTFTPDSSFGSKTLITGTGEDDLGIATIDDLSDGTYRLTETKAHEGYSLLKSPLILVIDRTGRCTVRSEDQSEDQAEEISVVNNVISLTISNRLLFELPSTGGYLRAYMIVGGLALAGAALFIYRLQKRRKGARAPRR